MRTGPTVEAGPSVEIDKVKELVQLMVDNNLSSISLRNGAEEITLRRPVENDGATVQPHMVAAPLAAASAPSVALPGGGDANADRGRDSEPDRDEGLIEIPSPMVGTFYASPNPEAAPFVQMGSRVVSSTVICIIEAMKVFNEIRSEVTGTIEKILVSNQEPVEYGQPLFLVRPV